LPVSTDYFEFFGLPASGLPGSLDIDLADLEKRYYQLSRKFHPDLFARKSAEERAQAEESSAVLNDAYRTLKDPVKRAEYVLSRNGLDAAQASAPPDLLEEVFELNMALEELRDGDESARPQLTEAQTKFNKMRDEVDAQLQSEFAKSDSDSLSRIRAILNRRNYIRNLLRDVEKSLAL
jgi:molecular chaperone HscB